jgi:hypothetical protein
MSDAVDQGRRWIFGVAILTLIGAVVWYFINKGQVEKDIAAAEQNLGQLSPAQRDEAVRQATGIATWDEAVARDRRMVVVSLAVDLGLAAAFLVLGLVYRKSPFGCALAALILYLAVILVAGMVQPQLLARGVVLKVIVIVALGRAVTAAWKSRAPAPAT